MPTVSDRWLGLALGAAAVACVVALPRTLGDSDEALILYETVRMLRGEVYLRDVFDFIPPGVHAYYALWFGAFGSSIDVARIAAALLHGVIVVAVFDACRRLDVRPALAAAAALAPLAIAQPAWPYASPHWLSTALLMLFILRALAPGGAGRAAVLGVLAGLITAVHQQKGVFVLACAGTILLAEQGLAWRQRAAPAAGMVRGLLALMAGYAGWVMPFFAGLVLWAGLAPTWAALIDFPLRQYAAFHRVTWGQVTLLTAHLAAYTSPRLLAALPLALLPVVLQAAALVVRGERGEAARRLCVLSLIGGTAIASVLYNADFIHLAFIAPVMLVAAAVDLELGLAVAAIRRSRRGEARPAAAGSPLPDLGARAGQASAPAPWLARLLAGGLLAVIAIQTGHNLVRARREYPHVADTAFGQIAVRNQDVPALVDAVRRRADAAPSRHAFVYPTYPALYLMTDIDNPTPFQILVVGYSPPDQFDAAIAALERSQAPLVVVLEALVPADDRVLSYVRAHYQRERGVLPPRLESVGIYRRQTDRPLAPAPGASAVPRRDGVTDAAASRAAPAG